MHFSSLAALLLVGYTAAQNVPSCGAGKAACPEKYPCCSVDGTCGNGYVCLGGCDPRYSHEPGSCVAMPIYKSGKYEFQGTSGVSQYKDYLGDAQKSQWSYLGNVSTGDNNSLRVQMFEGGSGSTVYSSYYLWYGKVTAHMKSSGGAGVVSDIILLSNVKDEVDYEFVGYDTSKAQTNYYWQGFEDYHNMVPASVSSDTENNYHDYTIDWQEDQVTWSIDGNVVRTLKKSDTKNATTGEYAYPQTPARIEFGLWPGGDSASSGTSEWAGGKIDWHANQGANPGYFFVEVQSIDVQAYDPPSGVNKTGSKSYVYTNKRGLEQDVAITDDDYVLEATDGTGDDLAGPYGHKSSSIASSSVMSSSSSAAKSSSSAASSSSAKSSSSSARSSSARSSSASSSARSSASANSTSASRISSFNSSSAASSLITDSFMAKASSTVAKGGAAVGNGNGITSSGSSDSSSSASSSPPASSSAKSSSSASPSNSNSPSGSRNVAGRLAVPAIAAILPALLL